MGSSAGLRDIVDEFAVCRVEVELLAETGLEREWGDALDIVLGDLGGTWGGVLICIDEAGLYASAGSVYWLEGILRGARAFGRGAENGLISLTSPAPLSEEGVVFCSYSSSSGCLFWTIVARGVRLPLPQREDRGLSLGLFRSICLVGGRSGIVAGSVNVSFADTDRHSAYENLTCVLEPWSWSPRTAPSNPFSGVVTGHPFAWFPR